MFLIRVNLEDGDIHGQNLILIDQFSSINAAFDCFRLYQPQAPLFAVIATHTDDIQAEIMWVMECGEPPLVD